MRTLLIPVLLLIIFSTSGCTIVTTRHPLSSNPKAIDQEKFEGVWFVNDDVIHVRFSSDGIARIAKLEWENNQFQIVHAEMIVTKGDGHNFLSFRVQENGKWEDHYLLLAYKFTKQGYLVLWRPNDDIFKEAIEKKELHGIIKRERDIANVLITDAPEKLLEFINDPNKLKLFEYNEPVILWKKSKKF